MHKNAQNIPMIAEAWPSETVNALVPPPVPDPLACLCVGERLSGSTACGVNIS